MQIFAFQQAYYRDKGNLFFMCCSKHLNIHPEKISSSYCWPVLLWAKSHQYWWCHYDEPAAVRPRCANIITNAAGSDFVKFNTSLHFDCSLWWNSLKKNCGQVFMDCSKRTGKQPVPHLLLAGCDSSPSWPCRGLAVIDNGWNAVSRTNAIWFIWADVFWRCSFFLFDLGGSASPKVSYHVMMRCEMYNNGLCPNTPRSHPASTRTLKYSWEMCSTIRVQSDSGV